MSPLVCIILVNYNGYQDTIDCVNSLLNIDYDNYKIIVVDNGSTKKNVENEIELLKRTTDYIKLDQNLGFSGGNNIGIKYSKKYNPEYYLLLNNDTTVESDFLSYMIDASLIQADAGIITGRIKFYHLPNKIWYAGGDFSRTTSRTSHYGFMCDDNAAYKTKKEVTFATGCLWLLPKDTIDTIGLLEEDYFLYCEDTDYCIRTLNANLKIVYIGNACVYHKVSASTGNCSDLQNYYVVRNSLTIIDRYLDRRMVIRSMFYFRYLKMILSGKLRIKTCYEAINDNIHRNMGKREKG